MTAERAPKSIWTPSIIITLIRILLVPVFVTALLAPWPEWFGMAKLVDDGMKRMLAAFVFVVISATDWLDGYLARSRNEITDFGKFIDPLADKILVAGALIALVELDALPTWVVLIILTREFIVSGVRMMAASKGVVIAASMLGKFKTVFQMIAIVLFVLKDSHMSDGIGSATSDTLWLVSWAFMLVALVLTLISLADYLYRARSLFGFDRKAKAINADEYETSDQDHNVPQDLSAVAAETISDARSAGLTLGTAESLTGGMIGAALTSVPGSSEVFRGGIISYAEEVKHSLLDVSQEILQDDGAVSERCARSMAKQARIALGSTLAVAVTGIAGPGGAEPGKPVGTVWIAVATPDSVDAKLFTFEGTRQEVRLATCHEALSMLRRWIALA